MDRINLMEPGMDGLGELLAGYGQPAFRAKQVYGWLHKRLATGIDDMSDLSLDLRRSLADVAYIGRLGETARSESLRDGTTKYLFRLEDGNHVECVLLVHDYGKSVCVSSQVGCRMGCSFCASTIGGLVRNLKAWEMEGQVLEIARDLLEREDPDPRIGSIVVMGSGEPMENLDGVSGFIDRMMGSNGMGIGQRHITVSTCGIPQGILEFGGRFPQATLAVSLHAPNDELRSRLMPINRTYPLNDLMKACREYVSMTGRRITFEYSLMSGVNDSDLHAVELAALLSGILCHVNLIPVNPVQGRGFEPTDRQRVAGFLSILEGSGIPATVRRELGRDIDAACGQLRRRVMEERRY